MFIDAGYEQRNRLDETSMVIMELNKITKCHNDCIVNQISVF